MGDRVVVLQFHIEVARENVFDFLREVERPTSPGKYIQGESEIRAGAERLTSVHQALFGMLDALEKIASAGTIPSVDIRSASFAR